MLGGYGLRVNSVIFTRDLPVPVCWDIKKKTNNEDACVISLEFRSRLMGFAVDPLKTSYLLKPYALQLTVESVIHPNLISLGLFISSCCVMEPYLVV